MRVVVGLEGIEKGDTVELGLTLWKGTCSTTQRKNNTMYLCMQMSEVREAVTDEEHQPELHQTFP